MDGERRAAGIFFTIYIFYYVYIYYYVQSSPVLTKDMLPM